MNLRHSFRPDGLVISDHPAVRSWAGLGVGRPASSVEVFRSSGEPAWPKSALYRLEEAGPDGEDVIAKRSRRGSVGVEGFIYQEVLARLPLSSARCYGVIEDEDPERMWIFLEQVHGRPYSERSDEDRRMASTWFGTWHSSTSDQVFGRRLPSRGPETYLDRHLAVAKHHISLALHSGTRFRGSLPTMKKLLDHLDRLESGWDQIMAFCEGWPRCIVHDDFIEKNAIVAGAPHETSLYVLDWELAGWGVPAVDLAGLDMNVYLSAVSARWPSIGFQGLEKIAALGSILRYVAWVEASSKQLGGDWIEDALADLEYYESRLAQALRVPALCDVLG